MVGARHVQDSRPALEVGVFVLVATKILDEGAATASPENGEAMASS